MTADIFVKSKRTNKKPKRNKNKTDRKKKERN